MTLRTTNKLGAVARCAMGVIALTVAAPVFAQAPPARDPAAADALFREARDAAKRGDHASACPKFEESQRLDPAPGTVLNLAQCEEKLGKLAAAVAHYREAAEQFPAGDPRIEMAGKAVAELEKRVPKLVLRLPPDAPAGTTVLRDAVQLGPGSLGIALPIDPGEHVVVVKAPGRRDRSQTISLGVGEYKVVVAELGEPLPVEQPPPPAVVPTDPPPPRSEPRPPQAVSRPSPPERGSQVRTGLLWTGGALVGVGAVSGVAALLLKGSFTDQCDGNSCYPEAREDWQTGKTVANVATGALLSGAVLMGIGLLMPGRSPASVTAAGPSSFLMTGRF